MANWKKLFCKHQYSIISSRIEGVTLSWILEPRRSFTFIRECEKCGHKIEESGYIVWGDKRLHPEAYDEDGWPIDEKGNKLEIAK